MEHLSQNSDGVSQVFKICGENFDVGRRYTQLKYLGEDDWGMFVSAFDEVTQTKVTIKKFVRLDNDQSLQRALQEIQITSCLKHENIIDIQNVMYADELERQNLFVVQTQMEVNLQKLIRHGCEVTNDHIRIFIYQLLRGLKYVHSANLIHWQLKPTNILINAQCDLRISDFSLARPENIDADPIDGHAEREILQWYAAPEILLNASGHSKAVDMWSVGCIMAEMLAGEAMFPGRDYREQLNCIFDVIGTPSQDDLTCILSEHMRKFVASMPYRMKFPWIELFPWADFGALDLLENLLTFNPHNRITVKEALAHPYFKKYHQPGDEPNIEWPLKLDVDLKNFTHCELKQKLFVEAKHFSYSQYDGDCNPDR